MITLTTLNFRHQAMKMALLPHRLSPPSSQRIPCVIQFRLRLAYSYSLDREQELVIKFLTPFIFNIFVLIFLKPELNRIA